jgi:cell shape-determining protein MreC
MTDRSKALQRGLGVIAPWGRLEEVSGCFLAGRLIDTGEFTARLQLVTDRGFSIRAKIQRVIDPGHPRNVMDGGVRKTLNTEQPQLIEVTITGDGAESMLAASVKDDYNIQVGDLLVTRNDEPLLPAQVRIGEVAEVRPASKGGFTDLRIHPLADLEGLREVYVVVPRGGQIDKKDEGPKR